jgi:hypothetical protein
MERDEAVQVKATDDCNGSFPTRQPAIVVN